MFSTRIFHTRQKYPVSAPVGLCCVNSRVKLGEGGLNALGPPTQDPSFVALYLVSLVNMKFLFPYISFAQQLKQLTFRD